MSLLRNLQCVLRNYLSFIFFGGVRRDSPTDDCIVDILQGFIGDVVFPWGVSDQVFPLYYLATTIFDRTQTAREGW